MGRFGSHVAAVFRRFSSEGLHFVALAMMSSIFALDVRRTQIYVAWGALSGLLAASWLGSFLYTLRGVEARALVPRRIAKGVPTTLAVELCNDSDRDFASLRLRGPFLPWDGEWLVRATGIPRLDRRSRARFTLEARFDRRGEHHLDPFRVQALVPLGLALGAPVATEAPRFLVVPRIATVASIALSRTRRHHSGGVPRALHTADSRELAGVRPYRPGDAMRDLHVRTWARTGQPFVREYQEEYFTHVAVVVDASRATLSPEDGSKRSRQDVLELALEGALSLTAGITAHVLSGEALVELLVVGEPGVLPTSLGRGRGTLEVALDRLAMVNRGAELDVDVASRWLVAERDRLSSVVLILSAWDEQRAELVRRLEGEGLAITVVLVAADGTPGTSEGGTPANVRVVSATRVLAGEAITC